MFGQQIAGQIGIPRRRRLPKRAMFGLNITVMFNIALLQHPIALALGLDIQPLEKLKQPVKAIDRDQRQIKAVMAIFQPLLLIGDCRNRARRLQHQPGQGADDPIGRMLAVHIDDRFSLNAERTHIDTPALNLVSRRYAATYVRSSDTFDLDGPKWAEWVAQKPEIIGALQDFRNPIDIKMSLIITKLISKIFSTWNHGSREKPR